MSAPHDDLQDVNPAQSSQVPDSAAEQAALAALLAYLFSDGLR